MLQLQVIGHLGRDAEKKTFNQGVYLSFSVAHTSKWKDPQGTVQSRTTWVDCLKKDDGSRLFEFLKKGTQVYLQGEPRVNSYTNRDGNVVATQCMNVSRIELLSGGERSEKTPANTQPQTTAPAPTAETGDDLPF